MIIKAGRSRWPQLMSPITSSETRVFSFIFGFPSTVWAFRGKILLGFFVKISRAVDSVVKSKWLFLSSFVVIISGRLVGNNIGCRSRPLTGRKGVCAFFNTVSNFYCRAIIRQTVFYPPRWFMYYFVYWPGDNSYGGVVIEAGNPRIVIKTESTKRGLW